MKFFKKLLIIPIILNCIIFSFALSDESDCIWIWDYSKKLGTNWFDIVTNARETSSNGLTKLLPPEKQKAIITNNDLNTAMLNLKKYCCENNLWWLHRGDKSCENDSIFFNNNVPDSPYLFDHLFDVIMRRLNWLSGEKNIYIQSNMTLDKGGVARRERISNIAESSAGSTPQTIFDEYSKVWSGTYKYDITKNNLWKWFWESDEILLKDVMTWETLIALQEYEQRTLFDRYSNSCALAEYFYTLLRIWTDKTEVKKRLSEWYCQNIINKQINWEKEYVKLIAKRSSYKFLANYIQWYFSYLYNRQQKLQKLRKDSTDRFLDVARAVPCLQKKCN